MRILAGSTFAAVLAVAAMGMTAPDQEIEVRGLHLCCKSCVKAAVKAVDSVGAKDPVADRKAGTLKFAVADLKVAAKALEAIGRAGFHGDTGIKGLPFKDDSGVKPGKRTTLKLSGVHNCCNSCAKPLKAAIMSVEGVKEVDLAKKATSFTVTGEFDGAAVIKAMNGAGYHAVASE